MKVLIIALLISAMAGCGGEQPAIDEVEESTPTQNNEPSTGSYCGDFVCDEDEGEDYWNCLDCVDMFTGGPKNGYCGDGICFNETMLSCFKDCRPRPVNMGGSDWDDDFPWPVPPGPKPGPGPDPRPIQKPFGDFEELKHGKEKIHPTGRLYR
jgi:hypothetical protein